MKISKKFIFGVCLMLLTPIILLIIITKTEMKKYEPSKSFTISDQAFGDPYQANLKTLEESFSINGEFISDKVITEVLPATCSLLYEVDDEILRHNRLSHCESAKPLDYNGLIKSIQVNYDKVILEILDTDSLVYKGKFVEEEVNLEKGKYLTFEGIEVELLQMSNIIKEGKREYTFKVNSEKFYYGSIVNFKIKTGKTLENVITVEKDAIYLNSLDEPFIRIIDEKGYVLEERTITVGMSDGIFTAVNGINVGEYYDLEYGRFINEK